MIGRLPKPSYEHLLGLRFALNVALGGTIVWFTLRTIGDSNPIWAIASVVSSSEPEFDEAVRIVKARTTNVLVGCAIGLMFLALGAADDWMIPLALGLAVLVSSYVVKVKTMWRQAPINAAVVIAAGITGHSAAQGFQVGVHKVAEVLFGCLVGVAVSWLMWRLWPAAPADRV